MKLRFLISIVLIVVVVAAVAIGATTIFSSRYTDLLAEQEAAAAQSQEPETIEDLAAQAELVLKDGNNDTSSEPANFENTQVGSTTDEYNVEAAPSTRTISATDDASLQASRMVSNMTLEEKICQMMIVSPEALTGYSRVFQTGQVTMNAYSKYPVGGIYYSSQNLVSQEQTQEMISLLQDYVMEDTGRGLFTVVREEGGGASVCAANLGTTSYETMNELGGTLNADRAYEVGATQASELTALGFNLNLAPCADVLSNEANSTADTRSFGWDADAVAQMVTQNIQGLLDGGMLCAANGFPGTGSTGTLTTKGFEASDVPYEELQERDLVPFQAAVDAGVPIISVASVILTRLDDEYPASLSKTIVTGILREELGFEGIIMTDQLNTGSMSVYYTNSTAAVQAISAGCDLLLCVSNISSVINAVTNAVENGTIQESQLDASCIRILSTKIRYGIIPAV